MELSDNEPNSETCSFINVWCGMWLQTKLVSTFKSWMSTSWVAFCLVIPADLSNNESTLWSESATCWLLTNSQVLWKSGLLTLSYPTSLSCNTWWLALVLLVACWGQQSATHWEESHHAHDRQQESTTTQPVVCCGEVACFHLSSKGVQLLAHLVRAWQPVLINLGKELTWLARSPLNTQWLHMQN